MSSADFLFLFFILLHLEPTNHLDMEGIIQLRGLIQTMHDQQQP
jgi:ATPase subunit of ABC transporter with duplicated ATPase domains